MPTEQSSFESPLSNLGQTVRHVAESKSTDNAKLSQDSITPSQIGLNPGGALVNQTFYTQVPDQLRVNNLPSKAFTKDHIYLEELKKLNNSIPQVYDELRKVLSSAVKAGQEQVPMKESLY